MKNLASKVDPVNYTLSGLSAMMQRKEPVYLNSFPNLSS
jgi:hypothetical protein